MSLQEKSHCKFDISKKLLNINDIIHQDQFMKDEPFELLKSEFQLEKEEHNRTKKELDFSKKQIYELEEKICLANQERDDILKRSHDEILRLKFELATSKEEIVRLKKQKESLNEELADSHNIIKSQKLKIKSLENLRNKELSTYQSQFTELQLEFEQERYLKKILGEHTEFHKEDRIKF